jgi:hypothetical protein
MNRIRIMGLTVVAALALTALAASSASALPELGECVKIGSTGGRYTEGNCVKKAKKDRTTGEYLGEYEWEKGTAVAELNFVSSGGKGTLETASGTRITCENESAAGEWIKLKSIKKVTNVIVTFKGCELSNPKNKCNTKGAATGEIVTDPLKGKIGLTNKKAKEVGEELTPKAGKTKVFVRFECGPVTVEVGVKKKETKTEITGNDCIIAPMSPANVMTTTETVVYTGSGGKQNPEGFYNTKPTKLCHLESHLYEGKESTPWENSTQTITATIKAADGREQEIKA